MNLSINPTYLCNLRCDFCYLTPEQLSDSKKLDLGRLDELLAEVCEVSGAIDHVDLYGGEISVLPVEYQMGLLEVIRRYYSGTINLNTNYTRISPIVECPGVVTSVSFDGPARDRWTTTLQNIAVSPVPVAVLILCSPKVIEYGVQSMVELLSGFNHILSVEIKPYSANQSNNLGVSHREFEQYVKDFILTGSAAGLQIENTNRLSRSLSGVYEAFSANHLYIVPTGQFAVLEFDLNDQEYFLGLSSIHEYKKWTSVERNRVVNNSYCGQCKYLGRCLTEHYRHVENVDNSCSGFYHLLEWYSEQKS